MRLCNYPGRLVNNDCFASEEFKGKRYLIFVVGSQIIIETDQFQHIQSIHLSQQFSNATCIAMARQTGKFGVAINDTIFIYQPVVNAQDGVVKWNLEDSLTSTSSVSSLCWCSKGGRLLSSGDAITIWRVNALREERKWEATWSERLPTEVFLISFSPDGDLFVTVGEYDCRVKVWINKEKEHDDKDSFSFVYLTPTHPRSVISICWRNVDGQNKQKQANVLLTVCRDFSARVWRQLTDEDPKVFELCAVINFSSPTIDGFPDSSTTGIHWIDSNEMNRAMKVDNISKENEFVFMSTSHKPRFNVNRLMVSEILHSTPDLLMEVSNEGSVRIWGIKDLFGSLTSVNLITQFANCISPPNVSFFSKHLFQFKRPNTHPAPLFPAELYMFGFNEFGEGACFTMNIDLFLSGVDPSLSVVRDYIGHSSIIQCIVKHPSWKYTATIDNSGWLMLWKEATIDLKRIGLFKLSYELDHSSAETPLAWFPDAPILAILCQDRISFVLAENSKFTEIGEITISISLSLHTVQKASKENNWYNIWGFTKDNIIYKWRVLVKDNLVFCDNFAIFNEQRQIEGETCFCSLSHIYINHDIIFHAPYDILSYSSENGFVSFWKLQPNGGPLLRKREKLFLKFRDETFVKIVKPCLMWRVAIVYSGKSDSLVIWEYNPAISRFSYFILPISEEIYDISWTTTFNRQSLLAVATKKSILMFCDMKSNTPSCNSNWTKFYEISPRDNSYFSIKKQMCLMPDGSLILGFDRELVYYHNWSLRENGNNLRKNSAPTLTNVAFSNFHPFPDHHPGQLQHYLLWGKQEFVTQVFTIIYYYLKLLPDHCIVEEIPVVPVIKLVELKQSESVVGNWSTSSRDSSISLSDSKVTFLRNKLPQVGLPYISNWEQNYLLAIMETIVQAKEHISVLDENGIRYLIFLRQFILLKKSNSCQESQELLPRELIWAYHSESQTLLLDSCKEICGGKMLWNNLKELGIPFWLRSNEKMRECVELIARNHFLESRDPNDCLLYYIALKKKNVVLGLWKLISLHPEKEKMVKFLSNDFEDYKWKTLAIKNAFALLGKHRYEMAAAFFLLGGDLEGATRVCVKRLKDRSLGVLLCRVVEGDKSLTLKRLIYNHLIPEACKEGDRWSLSLYFSIINQEKRACNIISTSLTEIRNELDIPIPQNEMEEDPSIIMLRRFLVKKMKKSITSKEEKELEERFLFQTILAYNNFGCPNLSFEILIHQKNESNHFFSQLDGKCVQDDSSKDWVGRIDFKNELEIHNYETLQEVRVEVVSRLLQNILYSIELFAEHHDLFTQDYYFDSYRQDIRRSLSVLHSVTNLTVEAFDDLLFNKCLENGSYLALLECYCLNLFLSSNNYTQKCLQLLSDICDRAVMVVFSRRPHLERSHVQFLARLGRNILISLTRWPKELLEAPLALNGHFSISYFVIVAYILWTVCSIQNERYDILCTFLQHGESLIKELGNSSAEVVISIIKGMLEEIEESQNILFAKEKRRISTDSACFSIRKDASLKSDFGERILDLGIMGRVVHYLDGYITLSENEGINILYIKFLQQYLLSPTVALWCCMEKNLYSLKYSVSYENVEEFINELPQAQRYLWNYLNNDNTLYLMVRHFISSPVSQGSPVIKGEVEVKNVVRQRCKIFQSHKLNPVECFTVDTNSYKRMVLSTGKIIYEIDIQASILFFSEEKMNESVSSDINLLSNKSLPGPYIEKEFQNLKESNKYSSFKRSASFKRLNQTDVKTALRRTYSRILPKGESIQYSDSAIMIHGKKLKRFIPASHIAMHPISNSTFYLVASESIGHNIILLEFEKAKELRQYNNIHGNRITRLKFNLNGDKFAASDVKGDLSIWNFETTSSFEKPIWVSNCHGKGIMDFVFIADSVIATAGLSQDKKNVSLWDTSLPPSKSRVSTFSVHNNGATSVVYWRQFNLLISGGKTGEICVFNTKTMLLQNEFQAHRCCIQGLEIDYSRKLLLSCSENGEVKLWSYRRDNSNSFSLKETWDELHSRTSFFIPAIERRAKARPSLSGVFQIQSVRDQIYSCGADGTIISTNISDISIINEPNSD